MSTKIVAAKLGTSAGVTTIITRSSNPGNILSIVRYLHKPANSGVRSVNGHSREHSPRGAHQRSESITDQTKTLNLDAPSGNTEDGGAPPLHTRFLPSAQPMSDRHFWLLHTPNPHGTVYIDSGAYKALLDHAGLLPVGVVDVEGNFAQHEPVRLVVVNRSSSPNPDGRPWSGVPQEVGRALVNYAGPEIARIMGRQSSEIRGLLGYADSDYIAHHSQIGFFRDESRPATPISSRRGS